MSISAHIARQFREVNFGVNWTYVNLRETLADITWEQAVKKVNSFNTIAALVYHMNYYVRAALVVLQGAPLNAHDKYSFDHPPIQSAEDWNNLVETTWKDAEQFAGLVEKLPDEKLTKLFADEKYGTVYRNLHGIIEHTHYHLGQIVLLKKLIAQEPVSS